MPNRPQIPTTSAAQEGELLAVRAGGAKLSREDLSAALAAGQAPARVQFDAIVFKQTKEPNRKFVRVKPGAMQAFAESFKGAPFLRDHERSLAARGGTILESKLVTRGGSPAVEQTIELTAAWAIQALADGIIDRFSVGFGPAPGADVVCSICGDSMWGRGSECDHWPGLDYESDGEMKACEMVYTAALGDETSAVVVPAVMGTEIEGIRAALAAEREENRGHGPRRESHMDFKKKLAQALGLAEDSTDDTLIERVSKTRTLLDAEREAHATAKAALASANAEVAKIRGEQLAAKTDAIVDRAKREGKLKPAVDGVPTKLEATIRSLAVRDLGAAEELAAELPVLVPVGKSQSESAPKQDKGGGVFISDVQKHINKQLGITDEQFAEHAPPESKRMQRRFAQGEE